MLRAVTSNGHRKEAQGMKIALVARHVSAPAAPSDSYAAEQAAHVAGLGKALAAQGHSVVIYARKDAPGLPDREALAPRLTGRYIKAGPPAPVPADQLAQHTAEIARYLAARWKNDTPDIVHAHHWTSGLAALLAARERTVPVVQTFGSLGTAERRHGVPGPVQGARIRMETCIARTVTRLLAVTSDEVGELARLGIPGSKVRAVPGGVNTSQFGPDGPAAKRRAEPRLLYLGPLAGHADLDKLLQALSGLPEAELVVAGGPDPDELDSDISCKKLGKLAASLGVADRVTFTGHVADENLPALMRSADLFVSAARYEPYGTAAIGAMACGKPVVASAAGAYADAVVDGTTGLLLPPGRPDVLARRLRDLLATPMKLTAFGIAAADRARSRYPWERIAAETAAEYERCIAAADAEPAREPAPSPRRRPARPAGRQRAA
jgi:D-inositol-3-phosphate glycosyltransferase